MKCKPVHPRYAPCWSGALMDPVFLRRAANDRAAPSDLSSTRDDDDVAPGPGSAVFAGVQSWWRRSLRFGEGAIRRHAGAQALRREGSAQRNRAKLMRPISDSASPCSRSSLTTLIRPSSAIALSWRATLS